MTVASLHKALLERDRRFKYRFQSDAKDRSRSLRNSLTRALRGLAKAGEAARNDIGEWVATGGEPTGSDRAATAHHEAGHAVIGLAVQLPVAFACITPEGRKGGYVPRLKRQRLLTTPTKGTARAPDWSPVQRRRPSMPSVIRRRSGSARRKNTTPKW